MGHFVLGFKALFRVWTDDAFASQVGRWLGSHPAGVEPAAAAPAAAAPAPAPVPQAVVPLPRQPRTPHPTSVPATKLPAETAAMPGSASAPTPTARNEALSLLAVLQRDARLLDFLKESIAGFSDEEVGAAARPVHQEAAAVIERIFGVVPLCAVPEGTNVVIPAGYDPTQYRLVGNVPEEAGPLHGTLVHPGWKAVRADVPAWNGRPDTAIVVAPIEVEF